MKNLRYKNMRNLRHKIKVLKNRYKRIEVQ